MKKEGNKVCITPMPKNILYFFQTIYEKSWNMTIRTCLFIVRRRNVYLGLMFMVEIFIGVSIPDLQVECQLRTQFLGLELKGSQKFLHVWLLMHFGL